MPWWGTAVAYIYMDESGDLGFDFSKDCTKIVEEKPLFS